MLDLLKHIKGIHPGLFLERELIKRNLKKSHFSLAINEHPQTIGSIIKGKRNMNIALACKIEEYFQLPEGLLMSLQVFYEIKQHKSTSNSKNTHPDFSKINPSLFWDTDIKTIEWQQMKKSVLQRVFERGSKEDVQEIKHFYGI